MEMRSSRSASQNGCDVGVGTGRGLGAADGGDMPLAGTVMWSRSLQDQRGLLAHDPARARYVRSVVLAQLAVVADTLDLSRRLYDHRHATGEAGLSGAQHAAVRVAREVALVGQVVVAHELHPFTGAAEP